MKTENYQLNKHVKDVYLVKNHSWSIKKYSLIEEKIVKRWKEVTESGINFMCESLDGKYVNFYN